MDPLSDVLSLVRLRGYVSAGMKAGGRWSLRFPEHEGIKCYAVVKGNCWVHVEKEKKPVLLAAGDCLMLPHGEPFVLCSDLAVRPVDAWKVIKVTPGAEFTGVHVLAPGDDFFLIVGHFALEGNADLLLDVLPSHVHLRKEAQRASLRGAMERMFEELRDPQPGGSLIAQQSAYTMLVLALRLYLAEGGEGPKNWLIALSDKQIAASLAAMHDKPSSAWTVQTLAAQSGMSRTTFAERFRKTVGETPMEYLTRWRMLLAADRLRRSTDAVSAIAESVGYESESAFSAAFKRTMGVSPREFARRSAT